MTQSPMPAGEPDSAPSSGVPSLDEHSVDLERLQAIAESLQESNIDLLAAVAGAVGMDRVEALLQDTLAVEDAGGMMLGDGSRRRTPGGVFFFLARKSMSGMQRQQVFPPLPGNPQRPDGEQASALSAPTLAAAMGLVRATGSIPPEKKGRAVIKTTVIGRVKQIKPMGEFILAIVTPRGPEPMPKGLPPVPDTSTSSVAIFVVRNQWPRVEAALNADPKDALIAEGYLALDVKNQLTGLWAQTCTTRNLQKLKYGVK